MTTNTGRRPGCHDARANERGFALPVTVLLIALITVMLTSGFVRVRADRQVAESQEVSAEALSIARSGLGALLESRSTRPPNGFVDTMYVTGGYAIVTADIAQNPADTLASQTWIIRSTGYVIDAGTGATPRATRTVAQYAEWQTGTIRVRGALNAPGGIRFDDHGSVTISGGDGCGVRPAVAGLRMAGWTGSLPALFLSGSPGAVNEGSSNGVEMYDSTLIDWPSARGGGIVPDFTTPQYNNFTFPVTMVTGDLDISTPLYGSGLLIVTGDLRARDWVYWYGIILVGGKIELDSYFNYVYGSVVTGLDIGLPSGSPARTELGWSSSSEDTFDAYFYYYSCFVDASLSALTGFAPIENAWVDNWAAY